MGKKRRFPRKVVDLQLPVAEIQNQMNQTVQRLHRHHQRQYQSSAKVRPFVVRGGSSGAGCTLNSYGGLLVGRACKLMNPCRWQQEDAAT